MNFLTLYDIIVRKYLLNPRRNNKVKNFDMNTSKTLESIFKNTEDLFSNYACKNSDAKWEHESKYENDILRSRFSIDVDKVIHSSLYNRGNDKTQVFSFYRNDDITRRFSHMQLVSRISRTIGKSLQLNLDLIEAIAIGHDVGHTPFGHKGEEFLNELYNDYTGRFFNHNVHSVRVLQKICACNLTLQTLDGILCHCGEKAFDKYEPSNVKEFNEFNEIIEKCYTKKDYIKTLRPSTLEGCVVRISDMIAYLGKDRQDAAKLKFNITYKTNALGENNAEIIKNITTDIIANSINKPYLSMSKDVYENILDLLSENNSLIYQREDISKPYYKIIKPMMHMMYKNFLTDLKEHNYKSPIFQHYLNTNIVGSFYRNPVKRYIEENKHDLNDIVVDFIASMTDDYFIDIFAFLFPEHELNKKIQYVEYTDERYTKSPVKNV